MRILKVTQTYYPYLNNGGPPAKVSGIAKMFVQRGHEVTVLTADRGADINPAINTEWKREKIDLGWESLRDGVQTIYLPTIVSYRSATFNPRVLRFCDQLLNAYDVVQVYGLYDLLGCIVARSCVRRGTPYVLEPLGMFGPKIRSKRKKHLYGWLIGTHLFREAKVVIANSQNEREELIRGGIAREKIVLRRNGLDLAQFQQLPNRGEFRKKLGVTEEVQLVLFLGRLSFIKGLDELVQAFANVRRDAKLIIAGPDDQDGCAKRIHKLISKLGLEQRIVLTGPLYEKEKLQAFVDANIFVLPSRHESFGNAAAESVACGTPVLVTDKCGIAPFIDGQAGIVTACSTEEIAKGINLLLDDSALLLRLAENCLPVARGLSWDEPVEAMERLYASLIEHREIQPIEAIVGSPSSC
jgi:glycosyltransferase involved in cell wall biosynthesis